MVCVGQEDGGNTKTAVQTTQIKAKPHEVAHIEGVLETWAVERHGATPKQVAAVKSCLKEDFLLLLVEPAANHYWPRDLDGNSWQYLFRRHCFRSLGVFHRIPEGHPAGLPGVVNEFLRTKWWPNLNSGGNLTESAITERGSGGPIRQNSLEFPYEGSRRGPDPYAVRGRRKNICLARGKAFIASNPKRGGSSEST